MKLSPTLAILLDIPGDIEAPDLTRLLVTTAIRVIPRAVLVLCLTAVLVTGILLVF